jgi:hypothetical protein
VATIAKTNDMSVPSLSTIHVTPRMGQTTEVVHRNLSVGRPQRSSTWPVNALLPKGPA